MATILVTGGAGFLGSHLCERLIARGDEVICVDNFFSGRKKNIEHATPWLKRHLVKSYRLLRDGASASTAMNTGLFSQEALDELDDADTDGSLESALGEMGHDEVKEAILRLETRAQAVRGIAFGVIALTMAIMYLGTFVVIADMLGKVFMGGNLPH